MDLLDRPPQNVREERAEDDLLTWGLSQRLPRWRAFDGLRSLIAPSWALRDSPAQLPLQPPHVAAAPSRHRKR
jgi:hypothetical protein